MDVDMEKIIRNIVVDVDMEKIIRNIEVDVDMEKIMCLIRVALYHVYLWASSGITY